MDFARVHPLKNTATMDHVVMVHHNHPFPVRQLSLVSSHRLLEYFDMFHGKLLTGIFHSMADLYRKEMIFQFFFQFKWGWWISFGKIGIFTLLRVFGWCHDHYFLQTSQHFHVCIIFIAHLFNMRSMLFGYCPFALEYISAGLFRWIARKGI